MATFDIYRPEIRLEETGIHLNPGDLYWRNGMLVRATNWLGDVMMTLPAVHAMRRHIPPACGLFIVSPKSLSPLWEAAPWVSHVVPMEGKRIGGTALKNARQLRAGVGVVLPNSFGSALDLWRCGLSHRIGRRGRCRGLLLTDGLPEWRRGPGLADRHQVSHYLELAGIFGESVVDVAQPLLHIPEAVELGKRLGVDSSHGEPWLAVAPGAAYGPAKQWSAEGFREVARWWTDTLGGRVVFVGTRQEAGVTAEISAGLRGAVDLAGRTSLRELMGVLSVAELVVANDSGAMHLAAGLGTRGVAVFGSTDPFATGPLGAAWVILREPADCAPCFARTCRRSSDLYTCLKQISAERVCAALTYVRQLGAG